VSVRAVCSNSHLKLKIQKSCCFLNKQRSDDDDDKVNSGPRVTKQLTYIHEHILCTVGHESLNGTHGQTTIIMEMEASGAKYWSQGSSGNVSDYHVRGPTF